MNDYISIYGAKEHNLKNIKLKIPKNKLVVITGLSGSGKSSLAFDTIYAEGQRRYVESLSSYARQFLEKLHKPEVEHIEGLSPAIAIEQRNAGGSPRSTVATQTEIYDYLRVLYARIGKMHCHLCGRSIKTQTSQEIIEKVMALPTQDKVYILAPIVTGKKGQYQALFAQLLKDGFVRVRVDGIVYGLDSEIKLKKYSVHNIEILVDRIKISSKYIKRIADAIETALRYSKGMVIVRNETKKKEVLYNTKFSCSFCDLSLEELEPRLFSFNSPYGLCKACNGLGRNLEFDVDLIIPNKKISIGDGAIPLWHKGSRGYIMYYKSILRGLSDVMGFSFDMPFYKLPKKVKKTLLYGSSDVYVWNKPFEGLVPHLERLIRTTDSPRKIDL